MERENRKQETVLSLKMFTESLIIHEKSPKKTSQKKCQVILEAKIHFALLTVTLHSQC